ncbi:signal recognition particle-docking protein FtsY [candidate division KSB1 bacterium]|nr:signal recognition particle-docking protein FtsY [candidate division KSB1 bacterium]MBL7092532.1 signal recognition particle-docking protein FtsY [candidate division KSB1 bacterium]
MISKLKQKLSRTREGIVGKVKASVSSRKEINEDLYEELEEILISGDLGVDLSLNMIEEIREKVTDLGVKKPENIIKFFKSAMLKTLDGESSKVQPKINDSYFSPGIKPYVIMVVGVNGTGKTTTIGKLAAHFCRHNKKVLLSAADTFRAAASEQLEIWAKRAGVDIIRNQPGADPAAVAFDSLQAATSRDVDVLIVDTAGRLHTKSNLMEELKKIHRVLGKVIPEAPHETLLVLDATTGQNGLNQAKQFTQAVGVNGIVLTKLDGTAKGGIVLSISNELGLPVKFIGVGEQVDDLESFDSTEFIEALFQ